MLFAKKGDKIVKAYKGARDYKCRCCGTPVVAKCGDIKVHHWAHKSTTNCSYKPMTQWHYEWQQKFDDSIVEVFTKDEKGERHIADVKNMNDVVIEFQHSAISEQEVRSRFEHYEKLIWVIDATKNGIKFKLELTDEDPVEFIKNIQCKLLMPKQERSWNFRSINEVDKSRKRITRNNFRFHCDAIMPHLDPLMKKMLRDTIAIIKTNAMNFKGHFIGEINSYTNRFNGNGQVMIDIGDDYLYYDVTPCGGMIENLFSSLELNFKVIHPAEKILSFLESGNKFELSDIIDMNIEYDQLYANPARKKIFRRITKSAFIDKYNTIKQIPMFNIAQDLQLTEK